MTEEENQLLLEHTRAMPRSGMPEGHRQNTVQERSE